MKKKKKTRKYIPMVMGPEFVLNRSGSGYHTLKEQKRKQNKLRKDLDERANE